MTDSRPVSTRMRRLLRWFRNCGPVDPPSEPVDEAWKYAGYIGG